MQLDATATMSLNLLFTFQGEKSVSRLDLLLPLLDVQSNYYSFILFRSFLIAATTTTATATTAKQQHSLMNENKGRTPK